MHLKICLSSLLIAGSAQASQLHTTTPHLHDNSVAQASEQLGSVSTSKHRVRVASFNAFLNRFSEGELIADLSDGSDSQAAAVAELIQRQRPDVILLNEFDYDAAGKAITLFQRNYLNRSQNGAQPILYNHVFLAPSNTGIASGFDLNNNGAVVNTVGAPGYGDDCYGFGNFPGQFAMVVLSRFPILHDEARTFQNFLWADMPGALLPDDANTAAPGDYYSPEELAVFRLSSKSHWDVPLKLGNQTLHLLAAHPTPPVFDGPEDRNGRRNHDEIRFWADYVTPGAASYIYDDQGQFGGLEEGADFVIVGDYNADPFDGDSFNFAIRQLLEHPSITDTAPKSLGGLEGALTQAGANVPQIGNPAFDSGDFNDAAGLSGNLRVDYVLPRKGIPVKDAGVLWPTQDDPLFPLVGVGFPVVSSDHRMVWADLYNSEPLPSLDGSLSLEFLGEATVPTDLLFEGTQVGGLSGIQYDAGTGAYLALSDDRSSINPARMYSLTIDLADGVLSNGDVEFRDVITLLDGSGQPFAPNSLDPEGLGLAENGLLYVASEGDVNLGIDPFVNRFGVSGKQNLALPVPSKFLVASGSGIRNNLAFESLALLPGTELLFTATENALIQDGPAASLLSGSPCRILVYDLAAGIPTAEYIYMTEPVADQPIPTGQFSTNGLVELLALGSERFLAVERSFSVGVGNRIRIYEVSLAGATDVSAVQALQGVIQNFTPVSKTLLLDLDVLGLTLDNIEGLTFGPVLENGQRSLILCSDNNFSAGQFTQFLAFAVKVTAGS